LLFIVLITFNSLFAQSINVAVASNISVVIKEIRKEFTKLHPEIKIKVMIGSSGKLTAQINHHAPYDIFMSADMKFPDSLYANGMAITKTVVYAQGGLTMLSMQEQDFSQGLNLVFSDKISKIAVANPKTAPYGKATYEALINAKVLNKIKTKFVFGESVSQTLSYTVNATDLGFVASSALYSPKLKHLKKGINFQEVDKKLYTPISQGIVILKHATKNEEAKAFYDFVLSAEGKQIFKNFGYTLL
jgi:molybdate transport system substrate-binding protein